MLWSLGLLWGLLCLITSAAGTDPSLCQEPKVVALQSIAKSVDSKGSQLLEVIQSWFAAFQENQKFLSQRDQKFLNYLDEHRAVVAAIAQSIQTDTFMDSIKRIDGVIDNLNKTYQGYKENTEAQISALQGWLESNVATLMNKITNLEESNKILETSLTDLHMELSASGLSFNTTASNEACKFPFAVAGNDCIHIGPAKMTWTQAREYCKGLGGDLMVPSSKSSIILHAQYDMKNQHHMLFDLMNEKRKKLRAQELSAWLGATVVSEGRAEWISPYGGVLGQEKGYKGEVIVGRCVRALVNIADQYAVWVPPCEWNFFPLCHLRV